MGSYKSSKGNTLVANLTMVEKSCLYHCILHSLGSSTTSFPLKSNIIQLRAFLVDLLNMYYSPTHQITTAPRMHHSPMHQPSFIHHQLLIHYQMKHTSISLQLSPMDCQHWARTQEERQSKNVCRLPRFE